MKDGQSQSKRHRGSSPPFQDHEQAYHDWMKDFTPANQESDANSETQDQKQKRYQEGSSAGQNPDVQHPASASVEQKSLDKAAAPQKDDGAGWQDDGGESG